MRPQPTVKPGLGSHCLEKKWFWRGTGSWAGMEILFVKGSQFVVMTRPGWEPPSMGSDPCCYMLGQVIGLRVVTLPDVSQMVLLTGARALLPGSVMEVET